MSTAKRVNRILSKMTPGTMGGESRVATVWAYDRPALVSQPPQATIPDVTDVMFVGGGVSGTSWIAAGGVLQSYNFNALVGAQPGDLAVVVIVRDRTSPGLTPVSPPAGWTVGWTDGLAAVKSTTVMWIYLDASTYNATHTFIQPVDADYSRGYAVFRNTHSTVPFGTIAHTVGVATGPTIASTDSSMILTAVFERDNAAATPAGLSTLIGYSSLIRFEANLGMYYRLAEPSATDTGGVGTTPGVPDVLRVSIIIEPDV